jgi:acyl-CoA thioesterase
VRFWIRLRQRLGENPALHAAAFAYLSDYWISFVTCIAQFARYRRAASGSLWSASIMRCGSIGRYTTNGLSLIV